MWRTIGFAPKKDNTRIYERFRAACDKFFEAKREFYAGVKTEMDHNLQLKTEICEAAEALQNSEEWKRATEELIALQARWKEIGAVSRRYSDQVWKRFRAACDKFFERKSRHFADVEGEHESNLRKKLALLDEMQAADVKEGGFDMIKDFQRRWSEIGFVPIKQKEAVQKRYKEAVDAMFGVLRGTERDRSMNRFKERLQTMKSSGDKRLRNERDRLYNKVRQMEQDIAGEQYRFLLEIEERRGYGGRHPREDREGETRVARHDREGEDDRQPRRRGGSRIGGGPPFGGGHEPRTNAAYVPTGGRSNRENAWSDSRLGPRGRPLR